MKEENDPGMLIIRGSLPLRDFPGAIMRGISSPVSVCRFERGCN